MNVSGISGNRLINGLSADVYKPPTKKKKKMKMQDFVSTRSFHLGKINLTHRNVLHHV